MGTSASNLGPKSKSDLLPTWYNDLLDPDDSDQSDKIPSSDEDPPEDADPKDPSAPAKEPSKTDSNETGNWAVAKGAISRTIGGSGNLRFKKAAKRYVKTLGGSKKAAKAATRGIITVGRLTSFLGSVATNGLNQALTEVGLSDCIGQTSEILLTKMVDMLAPAGNTSDDAIAREAMITTLEELYSSALANADGDDETILMQLTSTSLSEAVVAYISNFIFTKWIHEVGIAIEKKSPTEAEAINIEKQINEFIHAEVRVNLGSIPPENLDLRNLTNQGIIQRIFQLAYSAIEL